VEGYFLGGNSGFSYIRSLSAFGCTAVVMSTTVLFIDSLGIDEERHCPSDKYSAQYISTSPVIHKKQLPYIISK
jgi:hypothetical protein